VSATAAGGPLKLVEPGSRELISEGTVTTDFRYSPISSQGDRYRLRISPVRLSAVVSRGDEGFIARSIELGSLGYGEHPKEALADLIEAIRDYLIVLRDGDKKLVPAVAHHARFVELLDEPEESWFASVDLPGPTSPDASDVA